VLIAALALAACGRPVGSQQGYAPAQPIAFSHAVHSGDYKMDCEYCHFGAARSRNAGIPPTSVCMNCHAQVLKDSPEVQKIAQAFAEDRPIAWVKVHRFPDHAYFNHASHVVRGKVACQTCHGPVETMVRVEQVSTMAMGWCLDCHRTTQAQAQGAVSLATLNPPTDCSSCHR